MNETNNQNMGEDHHDKQPTTQTHDDRKAHHLPQFFRYLHKQKQKEVNMWDRSVRKDFGMVVVKGIISLVAIILMGCAMAALFYGVYWNYLSRFPHLPVAIINKDNNGKYGTLFVNVLLSTGALKYQVISPETSPVSVAQGSHYYAAIVVPTNFTQNLQTSLNSKTAAAYNNSILNVFEQGRSYIAISVMRQIVSQTVSALNLNFTLTILENDPLMTTRGDLSAIVQPFPLTEIDLRPSNPQGKEYITTIGLIFLFVIATALCNASISNWTPLVGKVKLYQVMIIRNIHDIIGACIIALAITTVVICYGSRHAFYHGWALHWLYVWLVTLAFIGGTALTVSFLGPIGNLFIPVLLYLNYTGSGGLIPFELCPAFYKFGWGFPMRHGVEGLRSIALGTYSRLGLNIGVLVAWFIGGLLVADLIQIFKINQAVLKATPKVAQQACEDVGQSFFSSVNAYSEPPSSQPNETLDQRNDQSNHITSTDIPSAPS